MKTTEDLFVVLNVVKLL